MKLEHQVTSLELSKRLKELGVKQESIFFYDKGGLLMRPLDPTGNQHTVYSAFTVAELGEMLPSFVETYKTHDEGYNWFCRKFIEGDITKYEAIQTDKTQINVMAKMLIYLLENKLI